MIFKKKCNVSAVNCGPPNTVSNGKVFGNESTYNSQIKYRCNDGYNMTNLSNALQICLLSGYWSGETPECLCLYLQHLHFSKYQTTVLFFVIVFS